MGLKRRLRKPRKVAHTDTHINGHCGLETESAQWADSVKIWVRANEACLPIAFQTL